MSPEIMISPAPVTNFVSRVKEVFLEGVCGQKMTISFKRSIPDAVDCEAIAIRKFREKFGSDPASSTVQFEMIAA